MRDLLVVVPTRARPRSAMRLLSAVNATATEKTDVIFGLDDDDDAAKILSAYLRPREGVKWVTGPRMGMAEWTNYLVKMMMGKYEAFASLGDDHLPRTRGWDKTLLDAVSGGGISYGNDLIMGERLCTAPVVSQNIVEALGWMCAPGLSHMCVDNVLKDIGTGADCLTYCPEVIIEHLHWCAGKAIVDKTYSEAGIFSFDHPDWITYQEWQRDHMAQDIEKVKEVLQ